MKKIYLAFDKDGFVRFVLNRSDALSFLKRNPDYKVVCIASAISTFYVPYLFTIKENFVRKSDGIYYEKK